MAASDAISKAFETGDISKIDSVVADDFVDHTDQGDKKGKDSLNAIEVSKYKDGKATEHWSFVNMIEMMKMMPQADMSHMNNMDTSKMK